jgi:hypothetical protein
MVSSEKSATCGIEEKAPILKEISLCAMGEQRRVAATLAHIDDIPLVRVRTPHAICDANSVIENWADRATLRG